MAAHEEHDTAGDDGEARHRKAVGPPGYWDLNAGLQFSVLFELGLREQHRLLDIGCGSLRGGRLFIPFLAPERYFGMEPNQQLVEAGIASEVGADLCDLKKPRFAYRDDFDFTVFDTQFDFMVAQSIMSHTHADLASRLLTNAAATLAPNGVLAATFFWRRPAIGQHVQRPHGVDGSGWVGMFGVSYTWTELQALAAGAGLAVRRLSFPHPRQTWFIAVHEDEKPRLPGLARATESWRPLGRKLRRSERALWYPWLGRASSLANRVKRARSK